MATTQQQSFTPVGAPDYVSVFNATTPVPTLVKGVLTIDGLPDITYSDIVTQNKSASVTPVAQVDTATVPASPTVGGTFRITIQRNELSNINTRKSYRVIAETGDTQATVRDKLIGVINGDAGALVTASSGGGGAVVLTSDDSGEEYVTVVSTNMTLANTTANTASVGQNADLTDDGVADSENETGDSYQVHNIVFRLQTQSEATIAANGVAVEELHTARVYVNEDNAGVVAAIGDILDDFFDGPDGNGTVGALETDLQQYLAK